MTSNRPDWFQKLKENKNFCGRCWTNDRTKKVAGSFLENPSELFGYCKRCKNIVEARHTATKCIRCSGKLKFRYQCHYCAKVFCDDCGLLYCDITEEHKMVRYKIRVCISCHTN